MGLRFVKGVDADLANTAFGGVFLGVPPALPRTKNGIFFNSLGIRSQTMTSEPVSGALPSSFIFPEIRSSGAASAAGTTVSVSADTGFGAWPP
jgi:hypothetical protein